MEAPSLKLFFSASKQMLVFVLVAGMIACSSYQRIPVPVTLAIDSLKKLDAATQVGVTHDQYFALLLDAKMKVDSAVPLLDDGIFRTHLTNCLNAYIDAGTVWRSLRHQSTGSRNPELADIFTRYSIQLNDQGLVADYDLAMSIIWKAARFHLESLTREISDTGG